MKKIREIIQTSDIRNIIAVMSVVGAFLTLWFLITKPIPAENKETVNLTIGFVLGGLIGGVNGYYFGASKRLNEESKSDSDK